MNRNSSVSQSQWPHDLQHELFSPAWTLGLGFESYLRHGCLFLFCLCSVIAAALRRAGHPSKKSHRLCIGLRKWLSGQGPKKGCRAIDEWLNDWLTEWMNSPIGIATRWTVGFRFPARARDFSLPHCLQTGSGSHPCSYTMFTRGISREVKRPGREADPSPSSAEVKNGEAIRASPLSHMFLGCDA
jgi:hypothetical protein